MGFVLSVMLVVVSLLAQGVELEQATNDQLLREVGRRMQGGAAPQMSVASYSCDAFGYVYVTLYGPDGKSIERNWQTGSQNNCREQTVLLNQNKTRVYQLTLIGVCDASGYLNRVPLLPNGTMGNASSHQTASFVECLEQAKDINSTP